VDSSKLRPASVSPLVSVIVVVYQAVSGLPDVVDSILRHKDEDVELVIIDGGSKDGTVEYLQAHEGHIDYWISEPDRGIYDAMNKAIAKAKGTYLLHLNVGDRLLQIPKQELLQAKQEGIEVAAFRVSIDGRQEFRPSSGLSLRFTNTLHHQGTFFRRDTFPLYNPRYRIYADFDVNQKLALRGARIKLYDTVIASHANDGASNQGSKAMDAEFFSVIRENYGLLSLTFAWIVRKWHGLKIMYGI
jgi:glycosyltransferase involved in cell wall biosynthesis